MVPYRFPQVFGDRAAELDRKVGDAATRIHQVGLDERVRRTSLNATTAASAKVGGRCIRIAERGTQVESGQDRAEKEPGTYRLIEEQRVLAKPAKASVFGEDALLHGPGVGVNARVERVVNKSVPERRHQRVELRSQDIVVVAAPGITRNPAARRGARTGRWIASVLHVDRSWPVGVVVQRTDNHTSNARHDALWIGSPAVREIFHLSGIATLEPFLGLRQFRKSRGLHNSTQAEA